MVRACFTTLILLVIGLLPASIVVGQTIIYEVTQGVGATNPSFYDARPDVDSNTDGDFTNDMDQGWDQFRNNNFSSGTLTPANIDGRDVLIRDGGDEVGLRTNGPMNQGGYTNTNIWTPQDTIDLESSGIFRASVNMWVPDMANLGSVIEFVDQYPVNGGGVEIPLEFNHAGFGLRTNGDGEMVLFAAVLYDDYVFNPSAYEYTIPDRFPPGEEALGLANNNLHIIDMIVDTGGFDPVADFYVDGVAVASMQNIALNAGRVDQNIVRFGDCCGGASDFDWAIEWFKVEAGVSTPHDPPPPLVVTSEVSWGPDRFGNWNDAVNWTNLVLPGNTRPATLGDAITSPQTIVNEGTATVKGITFDNANGYNLAGSGVYLLEADAGNATVQVQKAATAGEHQFQGKVKLGSPTDVTTNGGATLQFNNEVDLAGNVMTTNGSIEFNHSVVDSVGGGSLVGSGSLTTAGSTVIDTDLTFNGTFAIAIDSINTDHFDVSGTADLTGTIEVDVADGFSPSGSFTIVSAGNLIDGGLVLGGPDAGLFNLNVDTASDLIMLMTVGAGMTGDYNNNGVVDAADYTLWRDSMGTNTPLANDSIGGLIGEAHYLQWKQSFGSSGAGSGTAVPEPTSVWLMIAGLLVSLLAGRRN